MKRNEYERLAFRFYLFTLAVFATMMGLGFVLGSGVSQELYETWRDPAGYAADLRENAGGVRAVLFLDLLFMLGYGGAIALTAAAHAGRNPVMAWAAGLGIAAVVGLDIAENLVMQLSLDLVEAGEALSPGRVAWQAGLSGTKWFTAALAVVALTLILPRETVLERVLIWSARVLMPLGAGLFVTDALGLRAFGGLGILGGMGGGLLLLAVTIWQRQSRN